jgi:hypothetical protein
MTRRINNHYGICLEPRMDGSIIIHIPPNITDEQIDNSIKFLMAGVVSRDQGCLAAFSGYDADPRELYNIPEMTVLSSRLVKRGFISLLWPTTLLDTKNRDSVKNFFGALEIWAMSENMFTPQGSLTISEEIMYHFLDVVLIQANIVCKNLLSPGIRDGHHRA